MIKFIGILCLIGMSMSLHSQSFSTTKSGNWNDPSVWTPLSTPYPNKNDTVIILPQHVVNIPSGLTITTRHLSVNGKLTINSGGVLNLLAAQTASLSVAGNLNVSGTLILHDSVIHSGMTTNNTIIEQGGSVQFNFTTNEGKIPSVTWDPMSVLRITGYTSLSDLTPSGNWNQSFGNIEWDCPNQQGDIRMHGLIRTIQNDFLINNTGHGALVLASDQDVTIHVGGSLDINDPAATSLHGPPTSGISAHTLHLMVDGDFNFRSANALGNYTNQMNRTLIDVEGDFNIDAPGGRLITSLDNSTSANQGTIFNLGANMRHMQGVISAPDVYNRKCAINFVSADSAKHSITTAGTVEGTIAYTVNSKQTLRVVGESALQGNAKSSFSLGDQNGGAILVVESLDNQGSIQLGNTRGNIRVGIGVLRNYVTGSIIRYEGREQQTIGNGHPGLVNAGTVATVTTILNNSSGFALNSTSTPSVVMPGDLNVLDGNITATNNSITVQGDANLLGGDVIIDSSDPSVNARTFTINGNLNLAAGKVVLTSGTANSDNAVLAVNGDITGDQYIEFFNGNCRVLIGGPAVAFSRAFPINKPTTLEQFTMNRKGVEIIIPQTLTVGSSSNASSGMTLTNGDVRMLGDLFVESNLKLTSGTLHIEGRTLELKRAFTSTLQTTLPSGWLFADNKTKIRITGTYTNNAAENTLAFAPGGNHLSSFILNRTSKPTLPHASLVSPMVADTVQLINGRLKSTGYLSLSAKASFRRTGFGSLYPGSFAPDGGPYSLYYGDPNVDSKILTGPELNGIVSAAHVVSIDSVLQQTNAVLIDSLDIQKGIWISGHHNIQTKCFINAGTFAAPDTLFLSGNVCNDSIFLHQNGVVVILDTTLFIGSKTPVLHTIHNRGLLHHPTASSLFIQGNWINDGVYLHNKGTLVFNGLIQQKLSGRYPTSVYDLVVDNANVVNQHITNLYHALTISVNATFDADGSDASGTFTVKSTNDGVALEGFVNSIPRSAMITGDVIVERSLTNIGRKYRYLSSQVQSATVAQWMDHFPITGNFNNPSTPATWPSCGTPLKSSSPSLFYYDAAAGAYQSYPLPNTYANQSVLEVGRGYAAFIRDCNFTSRPTLKGQLNQGDLSLPVTFDSVNNPDGWNLVGNPYPSPIHWNPDDTQGWTSSDIATCIAIRNNETGSFLYCDGTNIPDDIPDGLVAQGQGFWVRAVGANAKLQIHESAKASGVARYWRQASLPTMIVTLSKDSLTDRAYLKINPSSAHQIDAFDAPKLNNDGFDVAFQLNDSSAVAINSVPGLPCSMPLSLKDLAPGHYSLVITTRNDLQVDSLKLTSSLGHLMATIVPGTPFEFDIDEQTNQLGYIITFNSETVDSVVNGVRCGKGSVALYANSTGTSTVNWYADSLKQTLVYQGNSFVTPEIAITTTYFVSTDHACNDAVKPVIATLVNIQKPIVTQSHDTLLVSTDRNIEWFLNGLPIQDRHDSFIVLKTPGRYTARASFGDCFEEASFSYNITAIEDHPDFSAYPNPVKDILVIKSCNASLPPPVVINIWGERLYLPSHQYDDRMEIDMTSVAKGIYVICIGNNQLMNALRISKE